VGTILVLIAVALFACLPPPPAWAEETTCRGRIGARTVDNLRVPQGARAIRITANRIDGNLQCNENRRRPRGGRNVVQGNKEDQCARL
jgi:hypothetical protein